MHPQIEMELCALRITEMAALFISTQCQSNYFCSLVECGLVLQLLQLH